MKPLLQHSAPEAGFTLVELLVAVTLLGFLSVLLFGGLRLGTRVWERTRTGFENDRALQAAEAAIVDALSHAYPRLLRKGATDAAVAFAGSENAIALTAWTRDAGLANVVVAAKRTGDELDLTVEADPEIAGQAAPSVVVLHRVASVTFAYFGAAGRENAPHWQDTWQGQRALPRLIRIAVRMKDGRATPLDLTIAPHIQAPMDCVFDPSTDDCRGR